MSMKFKFGILLLSSVIALYAIVGGLLPRYGVIAGNDPYSQMAIFREILTRIVEDYVDEPDLEKVRMGALRGLAEGLDPYSAYLSPEQVKRYNADRSFGPAGAGMELSKVSGMVYVVSVVKGSPADVAGIRTGHIIEYIGDRATLDMSLYDSIEKLWGQPGKEVELRVFRGNRSDVIKLKLDRIEPPKPASRVLEKRIGYLQVSSFTEGTRAAIRSEMRKLLGQGVDRVVFDLRGVAGGPLSEGVAVTNLFIGRGVLAKTVGKDGRELKNYEADTTAQIYSGPLVALVDRGTAGAAEVIAAAIIENNRGDVVGERTFGAGGEQQLFGLRDGGGLLITTIKYASPKGTPFMGSSAATSGVMPSVEVRRTGAPDLPTVQELEEEGIRPTEDQTQPTPQGANEDLQLKKAIEILQKQPKS
jgi:carboxyl-terminal processing protease